MSKGQKIGIGVGLLLTIVVLGGLAASGSSGKGVSVRTEKVGRRDLVSIVTASGKIEPKTKVEISADISGRVIQVAVEEGQTVQAGDLLLRIDPTQYEAALRRAEASVAQAQAQAAQARANVIQAQSALRRSEQLASGREQLISAADLEQARTQAQVTQAQAEAARFAVSQAQASVQEAREALRKTTIVAPMAGRVVRKNIEVGETAIVGTMNNPGTVLMTVADLSVMEATVKVDETDVPRISLGDSAAVRIDAFPDQLFSGRVTRIANSALQTAAAQAGTEQSVDFEVVITLDNPPTELRPDLSATADVVTDSKHNALAVPIIAVTVRDPDGKKFRQDDAQDGPAAVVQQAEAASKNRKDAEVSGVFVLQDDGKVKFVPVEVGITGDTYFEVVRGLKGGETVVSGSYQAIRDLEDGNPVRPQEPRAAPGAKGGGAAKESE
jgi:HlyD family secretion protein